MSRAETTKSSLGGGLDIIPPPSMVEIPAGSVRDDTMYVVNTGTTDLTYDAACPTCEDDSGGVPHRWLTLSPASSTVPPNSSVEVNVHYDTTGLAPGQYPAQIEVSSESEARCAPVNLTVTGSANCEDTLELTYPTAPNFVQIGEMVHVAITLGSGRILGGTKLRVGRVLFNLDCSNDNLGVNCTDDGVVMAFAGNVTSNCHVDWLSSHTPGDTLPNQVTFTPQEEIDIPAGTQSYCSLEFDIRVNSRSNDGTPDVIESTAAVMDSTCDNDLPVTSGVITVPLCQECQAASPGLHGAEEPAIHAQLSGSSTAFANTCAGSIEVSSPSGTSLCALTNDTVTLSVAFGSGSIQGGTSLTINGPIIYHLDCDSQYLPNCFDDGNVLAFAGNVTTTCAGRSWFAQEAFNEVVFTPSPALDIPAGTPDFCRLGFDIRVVGSDPDPTPYRAEGRLEVPSYAAICNTSPPLPARYSGNAVSSSVRLCAVCDDGNQCNGTETCDSNADPGGNPCAPGTPITCNDNNVCTSDRCDDDIPAPGDPCVFTQALDCDDHNICTSDQCDPVLGCVNTPGAQGDCNDDDGCTDDACDPILGCVHAPADDAPPECTLPCRIAVEGVSPNELEARIKGATFSGAVEAAIGRVGCEPAPGSVTGAWTHERHHRHASLQASGFGSLACGCDDDGDPLAALLRGAACPETGPSPLPSAELRASLACWTGMGQYRARNGRRATTVAFRVDVEDRGEAGGDGDLDDVYRMRIWIPAHGETAEALVNDACCLAPSPTLRPPDVNDAGNLLRGNIRIDR